MVIITVIMARVPSTGMTAATIADGGTVIATRSWSSRSIVTEGRHLKLKMAPRGAIFFVAIRRFAKRRTRSAVDLEQSGSALAAADAHRDDAVFGFAALALEEQVAVSGRR